MSHSGKVLRKFEFLCIWSCWENPSKCLRATEKNKEKVEANCTGFSAELLGFQSVEIFFFGQENKNSNVDNFFPELDKNPPMSS